MTDDPDPEAAAPHWTIEVCLDSQADFDRAYEAIEKLLFDMGFDVHIAGGRWDALT